jgi:hypothetical protein
MMLLLHIHRFAKIPHFALCGYAGCTENQLLFVMIILLVPVVVVRV